MALRSQIDTLRLAIEDRLALYRPAFQRLAPWLRIAAAAMVPALLTVSLSLVVADQMTRFLWTEGAALAVRALASAETPIRQAASQLSSLTAVGESGCSLETVGAFRSRVIATSTIANIGLVDASGALICGVVAHPGEAANLLPQLTPRTPPLSVVPDPRPDHRTMLVALALPSGNRLMAELSSDYPHLPTGPAFAAGRVQIRVGLKDGPVWRAVGYDPATTSQPTRSLRVDSETLPLYAELIGDTHVQPPVVRMTIAAIVITGTLAVLFVVLAGWRVHVALAARDDAEAAMPAPSGRMMPTYRPVLDIGTGKIIGLDLVVEPATPDAVLPPFPGAGLDSTILLRALNMIAPLLRASRSFKLSITFPTDADAMARCATTLATLLPRVAVPADQIVVVIAPGRGTGAAKDDIEPAMQALRRLGVQISLDRVVLGEGGGLLGLLRYRPQYVMVDADLARAMGRSEHGLAVIRGVVGVARDLQIGAVARGVVSREEAMQLKAIGITSASGPAFGPTLKGHEAVKLVEERLGLGRQRAAG